MPRRSTISSREYQARAEFRYQIRRFLRLSEQEARAAGLEPQQHQMLVALKGLPQGSQPTIGELANRMLIQHHSAVELVDRLAQRGMVKRARRGPDRRRVYLTLTPKGEKVLARLSLRLRGELQSAGRALLRALEPLLRPSGNGRRRSPARRRV
ncbi:MAG TPA: MarR family winged helix-turn-helix transcriptional regulator [Terriglobales bacterium]|nr:MarR family winged helix-turn-helix transcriptional regulator [Terriglobales bacterium]